MNNHAQLKQQMSQNGPKDQSRMTTLNMNTSTVTRDIGQNRNVGNNIPNKVHGNAHGNVYSNVHTSANTNVHTNMNSGVPSNNQVSSNAHSNQNSVKNNNYSLGLFIDNPQKAFIFDEDDLHILFSHYKGAKSIRILHDKAAAQITFNDPNMIQQVKKDINGLTINEIGTIRCIILNEGKIVEQFLPFSANDPSGGKQNASSLQNDENTVHMLKKLASLLQSEGRNKSEAISSGGPTTLNSPNRNTFCMSMNMDNGAKKKSDNMNTLVGKNNMKGKSMNQSNYGSANASTNTSVNVSANVNANANMNVGSNVGSSFSAAQGGTKSEHNDNPYFSRRLSRFELIDIFGLSTEFDVMKKILGKNNSNIIYINEQTNNNISIEIKGKPFNEAPVVERMHISLSSYDISSYNIGVELVVKLLNSIFQEFTAFCRENNYKIPENLSFKRHEYMYKPDGTTRYLGFKDKWQITKENYKNEYTFKKNKPMQKGEKEKRMHNVAFSGNFGANNPYSTHGQQSGDLAET
ncbi:conserved Plasmodium protein, unknown function [Plasmodium ovale]|uniref:KHDC4/BBP-like KH-domain type I domain-containing protein n=1 Tax=Plasmodium ovale TaxID=36330 RepID=A0A1D3THE2_PLAOA|nr:conserved Plasmodium protein, unknown function [Plasmodium ovale]